MGLTVPLLLLSPGAMRSDVPLEGCLVTPVVLRERVNSLEEEGGEWDISGQDKGARRCRGVRLIPLGRGERAWARFVE